MQMVWVRFEPGPLQQPYVIWITCSVSTEIYWHPVTRAIFKVTQGSFVLLSLSLVVVNNIKHFLSGFSKHGAVTITRRRCLFLCSQKLGPASC